MSKESAIKNLQSILLRMNYDPSKTLTENSILIQEQGGVWAGTPGGPLPPFSTSEPIENPNEYPNYCRYPKMTVLPGENEAGASGLDAIPEGYCCYPCPKPMSENGGTSIIFLPFDAKIDFWNEIFFDYFIKKHAEKNNFSGQSAINSLTNHYLKIFPFGTVHSFEISGVTYNSRVTYPDGVVGVFKWYYNSNTGNPYPKVKWTDPRNNAQKIIDDYIVVAQWVVAIGMLLAGFFCRGCTWLLLAEMITEGTLGIVSASRNLEKGENVSAAFDLIFAMMPILKTPLLSGISWETQRKLIRSMRLANLTPNSSPAEILAWYRTLDEPSKKAWSKMVSAGDEISEANLNKVLGNGIDDLKKFVKENPDNIKNVRWYQNVNLREFGVQATMGAIGILVEAFYGEELNEPEKAKLTSILNNAESISLELADEVKLNMLVNAEKMKDFLEAQPTTKLLEELELIPDGNVDKSWFQSSIEDGLEQVGGIYLETPSDSTKSISNSEVSSEEITKLEEEGYKIHSALTQEEWKIAKNPKKLNGVWYWKVR